MTTTILLLLNLAVYFSIVGIVTAEEVIRRKAIRNKGLSSKQKRDIEAIEGYEKSKQKTLSKGMLKNQKKLNSRKFRYNLAKHVLKAAKKKRFIFNRHYTIDDLTTKNRRKVKDLRKITLNEAYAEYFELKSELASGGKAQKYSKKAATARAKAQSLSSRYPREQKNIGSYERTISLPDGETHVDHRTQINCHSQVGMERFKGYVQENYVEPKHHRPTIVEMSFNGINKTSVASPSEECLEYGKIMLMKEALELASAPEYESSVFPIRVMSADTKTGKMNEGRIKATEIARYETKEQLETAINDAQMAFYNKYLKNRQTETTQDM